ncbi:MAG: hypothetical protein F6K19_42860 [Cyanothece sp. SIO1E1]|nr:hypothetical protein [Cyanothece sp. SIO1E1]
MLRTIAAGLTLLLLPLPARGVDSAGLPDCWQINEQGQLEDLSSLCDGANPPDALTVRAPAPEIVMANIFCREGNEIGF